MWGANVPMMPFEITPVYNKIASESRRAELARVEKHNAQFTPDQLKRSKPCQNCISGKRTLLECSRCHTPYCCKECQQQDWPQHKTLCVSGTWKDRMAKMIPLADEKIKKFGISFAAKDFGVHIWPHANDKCYVNLCSLCSHCDVCGDLIETLLKEHVTDNGLRYFCCNSCNEKGVSFCDTHYKFNCLCPFYTFLCIQQRRLELKLLKNINKMIYQLLYCCYPSFFFSVGVFENGPP